MLTELPTMLTVFDTTYKVKYSESCTGLALYIMKLQLRVMNSAHLYKERFNP